MKHVLVATILGGLLIIGLCYPRAGVPGDGTARAEVLQGKEPQAEIAELRKVIKKLQEAAPDQAHAMMSAAYHFDNLWFAAKAKNWPLAEFYWGETRSHLRWAVRINPVRKDNAKRDVDLKSILEAIENTPLKQVQEAIKAKDHDKFVAAYKFTLESCYTCHKASEKPYLRPRIPERPAESIINFDPKAEWPK